MVFDASSVCVKDFLKSAGFFKITNLTTKVKAKVIKIASLYSTNCNVRSKMKTKESDYFPLPDFVGVRKKYVQKLPWQNE